MKKFVKDTVGHFEVLVDHSQRPYEPAPTHVLKRLVRPLCRDFERIIEQGMKNDAWEAIEGFLAVCQKRDVGKSPDHWTAN